MLDGQQRLTALNVGLRGTYTWKMPRLWWNNPNAFPVRKLHLDLLWQPDEDDEVKYRFRFLADREVKQATDKTCWFPVKDILSMSSGGPPMVKWLNDQLPQERVDQAYEVLFQLYSVVHTEKMLAYYEEREQDIEKVLQIFIRTNSGGTILSYSDLLLSIAVAQWTYHDAKEEIYGLVDDLNKIGSGFAFSKDLVLKAGLMLSDIGSVGFKVENFNKENMDIFESKWDALNRALILTVRLVSDFGFTRESLGAHNSILPIAYYLYVKNPGDSYLIGNQFKDHRKAIREWLIRSLLKSGVWGSGLDTLLTALRRVIRNNAGDAFPISQMYAEMSSRGRSLTFEDEEIEDLADMQYGNPLTFALLSLLFPFVDLRNHFHVDHVFPRARFTKTRLTAACVPDDKIDDFIQCRNGLANLQLLEGQSNLEKSSKMPSEWLSAKYKGEPTGRNDYEDRHLLGKVPNSITDFDSFYGARRERLKTKIKQMLARQDSSS